MPAEYCSISSLNLCESIFGTASNFTSLLLLEYKDSWGVNPIEESKIKENIKLFLKQCISDNLFRKVLLIKNSLSLSNKINVFAVNNREVNPFMNHLILNDYSDLLDLDYKTLFLEPKKEFTHDPIYLVCTNGKKDKCCSKFGVPIFTRLNKMCDHVWQCSHVGGDRFAPNIIHLPFAHYYGHLKLEEIEDFYHSTNLGNIFMTKYRGRSCYNSIEQAADFYLRSQLCDRGFSDMSRLETLQLIDNVSSIKFHHILSDKIYDVRLKSKKTEVKYLLTCNSKKLSAKTFFELLTINLLN